MLRVDTECKRTFLLLEIGYKRAPSVDPLQLIVLSFEIGDKAEHLVTRLRITQRAVGSHE